MNNQKPLTNYFSLCKISLEDINWQDNTFSCRFFNKPSLELESSIKKYGLLTPPLLIQNKPDRHYRIVLGFKRLLVLKSLGIKKIPCQVIMNPDDLDEAMLWDIVISEYLCSGNSNLFDQSVIFNKIIKIYGKEWIISDILPLFNLPKSQNVLYQIIPLINLEPEIAKSVLEDQISQHMALRLIEELPSMERLYLCRFFVHFKFSKSKQFEILEYLLDLKEIFSLGIDELLAKVGYMISGDSYVYDSKMETKNLPQAADSIRLKIKSLRYPKLTNLEKQYNLAIKSLKLPQGISIKPPPFFEGNSYQLNITYQNKKILKKRVLELNKIFNDKSNTSDTLDKIHRLSTQGTKIK